MRTTGVYVSVIEINYYEILGVPHTATQEEIRSAYRKLSKEMHPDKGGDEEEFQTIQEAYEILMNPEKRATYDYFDGLDVEEVREIVIQIFKACLKDFSDDIEEGATALSASLQSEVDKEISGVTRSIMEHEAILKKIRKSPKKMDFLGDDIRKVIKNMEVQKDTLKHRKKVIQKAERFLLDEYSFVSNTERRASFLGGLITTGWFPGEGM